MINLRTKEEIQKIDTACKIVRDTLFYVEDLIVSDIKTIELDKLAEEFIISKGGIPGFKGLYGFPCTLCISIDDEVVHGIPSTRRLKEGEIVGVDVGAIFDDYYGDHAKTFPVGRVSDKKIDLIENTKKCLNLGIEQVCPENSIGDIGFAIQAHAEKDGYSVVRELVGHGIGKKLHEEPHVPNFGKANTGPILKEGMCLAIEPMINKGGVGIFTKSDGWTICTKDGLPSAHFEHTVTVTKTGVEILTI